jgi:hypothetical protein
MPFVRFLRRLVKITAFWDMTPRTLIGINISDESSAYIFRAEDFYNLKMEAVGSAEACYLFTELQVVTSQKTVFKFEASSFSRNLADLMPNS